MFRKKTKEQPIQATETVATAQAVEASGIDPKVVAAITAAIVAVMGTPAVNLKFTPIKRLGNTQLPWAQASNLKIMNTRQSFTEGGYR